MCGGSGSGGQTPVPQPLDAGTPPEITGIRLSRDSGWYRRDTGIPHIMNDVIWAGTQFLAVGNGGTIMTSPDGIEWTAQKSGTEFRKPVAI